MSDVATQILRRKVLNNPDDIGKLQSYIRALERSGIGGEAGNGNDYFVPYYLDRYQHANGRSHENCESVYEITFVCLPLIKRYNSLEEMKSHVFGTESREDLDPLDIDDPWLDYKEDWSYEASNLADGFHRNRVCGYVIIDKSVYDLLGKVNFSGRSDSEGDAIANYKTALCVQLAHTNILWRYHSHIEGEKIGGSNYNRQWENKWVEVGNEDDNGGN